VVAGRVPVLGETVRGRSFGGGDRVKAHFSDQAMADLILIIAVINTWNRLGATAHPWPLD
jgi:alkylhydroperoxidase family enzyme